ncbi:hypothetical protein Ahy_A03g014239 [Arachis hypogaea]|uniref:Uncharacterized protein n=2 Tax=Arachis TaxID=3817 RepID=A0A445DX82_ARAHY|nr:hypothetical protein Ahy_A03g014239 [Arachis hypogaea]
MAFNGASSWEQVPYRSENMWQILWKDLSRRGSCGCKREEKGGGGTSGQGHSSEAETHDQESAARSRERKQDLGNSRGGKSSCNLISNSYKVMHEVQQPGTGKSQQDRSNFFSSTNASALYKPFAALSTGMKRLSPYDNSAVDAYPKKTRAVINKGEYERSKVVSTAQKPGFANVDSKSSNPLFIKNFEDSILYETMSDTWAYVAV